MRNTLILLLTFAGIFTNALAQYQQKTAFRDGISITPQYGITAFFGDIGSKDNQGQTYGLILDKEFKEIIGVKLQFDNGNIQGTYTANESRIYQGKADYFQLGTGFYLNLSNLIGGYDRYRKFFFSSGFGAGLINYNETNQYLEGASSIEYDNGMITGADLEQVPFTTNLHYIDEHGNGNAMYMDGNLMIDYKINTKWFIKLDASYNYLFTSRIDGIEHNYYNQELGITIDPNSSTESSIIQSSTPIARKNDSFLSVKIGIRYRLSYKKRNNNTGTATPSNRHKWKRLPNNQFFDNISIPGTNTPKVIK